MGTLIYSPAVKVLIKTAKFGVIDVTDDLSSGSLTLRENMPSSFSCVLINHRRKYDLVFTPNDTIVVQMKRTHWMPVFAGYLNQVPYYSVYPKSVPLTATDTLKQLKMRLWDAGAPASVALMNEARFKADPSSPDGGIRERVIALLTEVGGWERNKIHIGRLPDSWLGRINKLYEKVTGKIQIPQSLGTTVVVSGDTIGGDVAVTGLGNSMTGQLPATSGRTTQFGGPNGGAYGSMALTGESGVNPTDAWYCAMQWPYAVWSGGKPIPNPNFTSAERNAAKDWWRKRKILVINPVNNKAVVLRPADWGPNPDLTESKIDISPHAMSLLVARTGDSSIQNVQIRFVDDATPTGPFAGTLAPKSTSYHSLDYSQPIDVPSDYTYPAGMSDPSAEDMKWGGYENGKIPSDKLSKTSNGRAIFHPVAAKAMDEMLAAAAKAGVKLNVSPGGGYRTLEAQIKRRSETTLAAPIEKNPDGTPRGTSNHGWAFAADMTGDSGGLLKASDEAYEWMANHARQFGWAHPSWARPGGRKPEAWHWEFWAGLKYADIPIQGTGLGTTTGVDGRPLLNTFNWMVTPDVESSLLSGPRALMNDSPLLPMVDTLVKTTMRSYMAGPNGDFISWFPDYFGLYGTAATMVVRDIELANDGFSIVWSDEAMVTHQFAAGSAVGGGTMSLGNEGAARSTYSKYATMGVATIDFPEIMEALLNLDPDDAQSAGWLDRDAILRRFGARVNFSPLGTISSHEAEFWYACWMFQRNWSEQFSAQVDLTWMPEVYPGMLLQIPTYKFQAYVEQVTHSFDFGQGGWNTAVRIIAPSASDGSGLYGLTRAVI